jgi:peptide-methionine (S)-S-oxide reductase
VKNLKGEIMIAFITRIPLITFLLCCAVLKSCGNGQEEPKHTANKEPSTMNSSAKSDTATFGGGCFWCIEAVFQQLDGVEQVTSGYAGGTKANPTYEEVCTGNTGHAEVCRIIFDPEKIGYTDLLEAFFSAHDPTTLNRQGPDAGTQYRSAIFYHSESQKELAEKYKTALNGSGKFSASIVTEITPLSHFYPAEDYHQNYYKQNSRAAYCQFVIRPKLDKFTKEFKAKLKHEAGK